MKKTLRIAAFILAAIFFAGTVLLQPSVSNAEEQTGEALSGFKKQGGYYYYYENGKPVKGWKKIGKYRYYFDKKGRMATGTKKIKGILRVFRTNGKWINTASMDRKAAKKSSRTDYLVLVNINKKVTKVYQGSKGNWKPVRSILCTVGDPTKGWDTVKGTFYVGRSSWGNPTTRGYSFEDSEGHTLYYWTRFCDDFLFHSQLYENNSFVLTRENNALGKALSHGCVRMRYQDAKWIYYHVPDGSKVIVY